MRTKSTFLFLFVVLLSSQVASAQVSVRIGGGYCAPPRAYYAPRPVFFGPRAAVIYAVPVPLQPVVVVPAPYYAPRLGYAPRFGYGYRGRARYGRRW